MSTSRKIRILVEGPLDAACVNVILAKCFPALEVEVKPVGGKRRVLQELIDSAAMVGTEIAALVDADQPTVADALEELGELADNSRGRIFFAIPTIESWLFADPIAALDHALDKNKRNVVSRLQLPEEIPYPKYVAQQVFCSRRSHPEKQIEQVAISILQQMSIDTAVLRSASMRAFLAGIGDLIGDTRFTGFANAQNVFGRRVLASLVGEKMKSGEIIYRSLSGLTLTSSELQRHIAEGTAVGNEYASDLLRVARELLAKTAKRSS